jgi:DNA-directed RNA polymerase specialized sigma24 family protein
MNAVSKGAELPSPPITAVGERQQRFEAVYADNHAAILGYVLRRTQNPDDAADVIADTFLTAWRRLEEMPSGPDVRLWLYGVTRRVLANHYRGERRRSALSDRLRADLDSASGRALLCYRRLCADDPRHRRGRSRASGHISADYG